MKRYEINYLLWKYLGALIGIIICSGMVQATSIGSFKQDTDVELYQTCNNCTYCNLTDVSIISPIRQNLLVNVTASIRGTYFYYNLSKGNTSTIGTYSYCYDCGNIGEKSTGCLDFNISPTGVEMTGSKSAFYIILLIISILIFILLIISGASIDGKNNRNEMTGYILAVNNLKYLKYVLFGFSYLVALFIFYLCWMISIAYLDMNFISSMFQFIFYFLAIATLPLFILFSYILIANWVRDAKIHEMLGRGLSVK